MILELLRGGTNIVDLKDVVKDPVTKTPSLIFEYVDNYDFRKLYEDISDYKLRLYMFEILRSLD